MPRPKLDPVARALARAVRRLPKPLLARRCAYARGADHWGNAALFVDVFLGVGVATWPPAGGDMNRAASVINDVLGEVGVQEFAFVRFVPKA